MIRLADPFRNPGPLGTTNYLYDGMNPLEEVDSGGNLLAKCTQTTSLDEQLRTSGPARPVITKLTVSEL